MDLFKTFGHFHVLLLHLPIGLIAGVGVLEALSLRGGGEGGRAEAPARTGTRVLLWLLAMSSVCAASTGYVLSLQGYIGSTLQLHMWLGIGVAVFSMCTLVAHERVLRAVRQGRPAAARLVVYRLGLLGTIGLIVPAGHLGGTLTHGDDFLFGPGPPAREATVTAPLEPTEFNINVLPVLEANCYTCHSGSKQKGGLALHTHEALLAGGKNGPVVVAGDAGASEIVRRLRLPIADDRHMPPKDKPQPDEAQIEAVEAWIRGGASLTSAASPRERTERRDAAPAHTGAESPGPREKKPVLAPADAEGLGALRSALVHVQAVEPGSPLLWIDFGAPASAGLVNDERVAELLRPVVANVQELSLARSGVTDRSAPLIAGMVRLRKLDLSRTAMTDAGLAVLSSLKGLDEINLVGTAVSDASVSVLSAMPGLKRVFLWGTKVTPAGLEKLRNARSGLAIEAGESLTGRVLEEEGPPKLAKASPQGAVVKGTEVDRVPLNAMCPVTGKAVDGRFVILYEGRRIGFCCSNCAKKFWDDPDAYLKVLGD